MNNLSNPKISIITVCYNEARLIEETIKNVLSFDQHQVDYIIIDGNSSDGTVDIIKKYEQKLKFWISEPDNGVYDAMNKGWNKAINDSYILFLGSGDLVINMPDADSFKNGNIIAGSVQIGNKFLYKPKVDIRLKLGNTLHHQALLIKKSLYPDSPFNPTYKTYADFDFSQRLLKAGHKIHIDSNFKGYALEGGLSSKFDKKQSLAVVKNNFGWFYMTLAFIYYYLRHEL